MINVVVTDGQRRRAITCEAILFDMDGTLVDSTYCVESTWRNWAMRHEIDIDALLQVAHGRRPMKHFDLSLPTLTPRKR